MRSSKLNSIEMYSKNILKIFRVDTKFKKIFIMNTKYFRK